MRARIHRGAHEIGGNCVELEHDGQRLVLDVGRPLNTAQDEFVPLPPIDAGNESLLGVLITHYHADHWGLVDQVRSETPVWMGAATHRVLKAAGSWTTGLDIPLAGAFQHRVPFELGPFTITPYLNDHSAFDAYSLLVEAGGRRLFYTGDIRGHGRKAGIFEELVRIPPRNVHVLLMEGTNIGPEAVAKPTMSEADVEQAMLDEFRSTHGLALVVTSAQNIDRLVTIYRATLRSGRTLVMDAYSADVARATHNPHIPRPDPDWDRVRAYLPRWQALRIKQRGEFDRLRDINPYRIFPEQLAADPGRFVLLFHESEGKRLADAGALDGASCTWSLWAGYLREGPGQRLRAFLNEHGIPFAQHHTSGHATPGDLRRLATAIGPGRLVPIHTFGAQGFAGLYDEVDIHPDSVWWDV